MPDLVPSVAGQNELEALYSATRKADLKAEQHDRLRVLAQAILSRLQQAARDRAVIEATEKVDDKEAKPEA